MDCKYKQKSASPASFRAADLIFNNLFIFKFQRPTKKSRIFQPSEVFPLYSSV